MSIDDYRHHGLTDEAAKAQARATMRDNYERVYRTAGPDAAAALLAKHQISPSADDIRQAHVKAERFTYDAIKQQNPFAAANYGARHPEVFAPGVAPATKATELAAVAGRAWETRSVAGANPFETAAARRLAEPPRPVQDELIATTETNDK